MPITLTDRAAEHVQRYIEKRGGIIGLTASDEDVRQPDNRVGVARHVRQDVAVGTFGGGDVTSGGEAVSLPRGDLVGRWQELLEERADLRFGDCAGEFSLDLAVDERFHGRDALDAVLRRGAGILVGIELYEQHRAVRLSRHLFDNRTEHPAGPAPGGPKIDHNGPLLRGFEDGGGEGGIGDLEDGLVGGHGAQLR